MTDSPAPLFRAIRVAFALYALALFTATHWPRLEIPIPIERPDIYAHMGAFGTWCVLITLCGFFGERGSPVNLHRSLWLSLAYAAADEGLQAIPFVHRTAAWDDFGANAAGVLIASSCLLWWSRRTPRPGTR